MVKAQVSFIYLLLKSFWDLDLQFVGLYYRFFTSHSNLLLDLFWSTKLCNMYFNLFG